MNAIVAICEDWGIGNQGELLVRNKADMRHFVSCTSGGTVIMGRTTLDSFPGGRPLKNRRNIVLTRQADFSREGVEVAHSVEEALDLVAEDNPDDVWVIGGASVYEQLLGHCKSVVVTRNGCTRPADTYFPNLDELPAWRLASRDGKGVTEEGVPYSFLTYRQE